MGINYKYDAFISYRHVSPDKEIAEKLQKKLENYTPPKALRSDKKQGRWHIFRDETELPTSSDLSNDIKAALESSRFLIVICSRTTKNSRWCMEEIEYFKELHNGNNANIITLVADGNPKDVFPPLLCNELIPVTDKFGNTTYQNHIIEPLAANVTGKSLRNSFKRLNTEFLRIAAPMLGCGYDALYNREHKKKIRRIFSMSSVIITILLLFGIYNSTMLWEINNRKTALAAANEDLQRKTEELNRSNQSLQQSNDDLAKKTKEAQENLAEANKQKRAAEDNLTEADKQRKIAEQNLAEANKQKKIAEDNLAEANRQQAAAKANAQEANLQRGIAEENMRTAQKNEAAANEANTNLKIKTSEVLANQAQTYYEKDDIFKAIQTAADALELCGEEETNIAAENVLIKATGVYSTGSKMLCNKINLPGLVKFLEFGEDGAHILASDSDGIIYIIDYEKNEIIKTYTPLETFGKTTNYITDIIVDKNIGYVLRSNQAIAIDLSDGTEKWRYINEDNSYFDKIVTNSNSDYLALKSIGKLAVINKQDGEVCYSKEIKRDYMTREYEYMDSFGRVYIAYDNAMVRVIDFKAESDSEYRINAADEYNILAMGENEKCIFLNLGFKDKDYINDKAKLICFNKSDMSVKWERDYEGEYFSAYSLNQIFEFTHSLPKTSGEFIGTAQIVNDLGQKDGIVEMTGIIVVCGRNLLAFDTETGEEYFKTVMEPGDEIIYCQPKNKRLVIGKAKSISYCYLGYTYETNEANLFPTGGYSFDRQRKYITYADGERYALASDNSSEISIYHKYSLNNMTEFKNFPSATTGFDATADNNNGIFAASGSVYDSDSKTHYYVIVYDTNRDEILMQKESDIKINTMKFIGKDKLFTAASDGSAEVLNLDGSIYMQMNLSDMIRECVKLPDNAYIDNSDQYVKTAENAILYCVGCGIFEIELNDGKANMRMITYNQNLSNYCVDNNLYAFLKRNLKNNTERIAYFKNGDEKFSYINDGSHALEFKQGTVSSIVCNGSEGVIAFINKEGYIGIYKYGADAISKIPLNQSEVTPVKILLTADAEHIIVMCSNGNLEKYSTKISKKVGECDTELALNADSQFDFIDKDTLIARKFKFSSDVIIVNVNTMGVQTKVNQFIHFMKQDKKIIAYTYIDSKKTLGYYNYLSKDELVEFASNFLKKFDA